MKKEEIVGRSKSKIKLIQGDCLEVMKRIKSGKIDLILTDLPYGAVKDIKNVDHGMSGQCEWDVVIDVEKIMDGANRILRKNGKMVLFAQNPFTTELINKATPNLPYCYSMIWEKDHFANSLIAKKAPVSYYEDILVFSKKHDFEKLHLLRPYFKKIFDYIGETKKTIIEKIGQRGGSLFQVGKFSVYDLY